MNNIIFASSSGPSIHTYGGGDILKAVFTAVAMLFGDNGIIGPMLFLCAAIGAGFACCKLLKDGSFDHFFYRFIIPFFVVYTVFSIPKTTVFIEDHLHSPKIVSVDNVPRLLAHFAEITSSIGFYLTEAIETAMHPVNDMKYSNTGMVFGAETALDFKKFQITNPDLKKDLMEFSKQCVLYDLALGRYSLEELKKSTDIWEFFKKRTSSLGMIQYCPPGSKDQCTYLSCSKVIEKFQPLFDKEKEYYAKQEIGKNLPLTFQALTKVSKDSEKLISQQLMINVLSDQFSSESFSKERASWQQYLTYQGSGAMAGNSIIYLRSVIEALIYGMFFLVLPISLLPGFGKIIAHWATGVVWIQLWPPLYAILSYIASVYCLGNSGHMSRELNEGLSIFSNLGLQSFSNNTSALAGYFMMSVPVISYYILQGGLHQFVQLASSAMSPVQQAISTAAAEQATGNYSYDNINVGQSSFGNTTAFQANLSPSIADGYFVEQKGFEKTEYTAGGVIYSQNSSNLASSINADQVFGESLQHQRQHAESNAETASKQYQDSVSSAVNSGASWINHLAHGKNLNETNSSREAYDAQQSARQLESAADNWGRQFGLSTKESLEYSIAGAVGGELGFGFPIKAINVGFNGSFGYTKNDSCGADQSKIMSSAINFAQSQEFQQSFQKVKDFSSSSAVSSFSDEGTRFSHDMTESYNALKSSQETYQAAKTSLDQVSDTSAWYEQNSHLIKDNLNQKYVDWAIDQLNQTHGDGSGFERFKDMMSSSDSSEIYQRQRMLYEFVQSEIDQKVGIQNPLNYREPSAAYDSSRIEKIDVNEEINSVYQAYSENIDRFYNDKRSLPVDEDKLKSSYYESKEDYDSKAYFTRNSVKSDRNFSVNEVNWNKRRPIKERIECRDEESVGYEVSVLPFFQRELE